MSSYLTQAGTSLYFVPRTGSGATALTLPTGITLYGAGTPCRAVLFMVGSTPIIIVANGGTHDFWIDQTSTARQLQMSPPISAPVVSTGTGTGLTGTYACACTFKVKDSNGTTLMESGLGPLSTGQALTNQTLRTDSIPVSGETFVNARGLYRTLNGGTTLYPWFDIDNNSTLSEDRGVADASLSLLSAEAVNYGTPPDLKLITVWKDIAWGVPRLQVDHVRWTQPRVFYGWSATNDLIAPPQNYDAYGVTAFIPRRDQLGIARWDRLHQITGDSNDTFARTQVSPNIGCVSQESVVVVRDVAYWLGERGVVEWTSESCTYVSDAQVQPWFTTDDYLNRTLFTSAQGRYNPDTDCYELLVALAGSSVLNAWLTFDLQTREWLGPNISALPLSCCGTDSDHHGYLRSASGFPIAVFGTLKGQLQKRDPTVADDDNHAVAMDVQLPVLGAFAPEQEKVWLDPTLHTRVEPASPNGNMLAVTTSVGSLTTSGTIATGADVTSSADLTTGYQRLNRPGTGRYVSFRFQHEAKGERVRIHGLEVPVSLIGRRDR